MFVIFLNNLPEFAWPSDRLFLFFASGFSPGSDELHQTPAMTEYWYISVSLKSFCVHKRQSSYEQCQSSCFMQLNWCTPQIYH